MPASERNTIDRQLADVSVAIDELPWRSALPADGVPAHQYVIQGRCPADAWDTLAAMISQHPDGYDAYFRGYPWPMHYWEFEGRRYWRTSARRTTHMLNRCSFDSVEPPRRVDEGAKPIVWDGPPWAPNGTPWPPGYVPGPGPVHMRGMTYRKDLDPRAGFECQGCGIEYWLYEPGRPCPRCGSAPGSPESSQHAQGA